MLHKGISVGSQLIVRLQNLRVLTGSRTPGVLKRAGVDQA